MTLRKDSPAPVFMTNLSTQFYVKEHERSERYELRFLNIETDRKLVLQRQRGRGRQTGRQTDVQEK